MRKYTVELEGTKINVVQDDDGRFILPQEVSEWKPMGTALKPAWEPIVLAMKPLDGTFAANAIEHGVAGLNVDGARIGTEGGGTHCTNRDEHGRCRGHDNAGRSTSGETFHGPDTSGGRFPANLLLDEEAARALDEQTGHLHSSGAKSPVAVGKSEGVTGWGKGRKDAVPQCYDKGGGASRFFYCAKASKRDRNLGLPVGEADAQTNRHPTVKPVELMRYLVRLVTMPSGILVLDPFTGSGSTGVACALEGVDFVGIEREAEYADLARARIEGVACTQRDTTP